MAMETTTTAIDITDSNTAVCELAGFQLEWSSIISDHLARANALSEEMCL